MTNLRAMPCADAYVRATLSVRPLDPMPQPESVRFSATIASPKALFGYRITAEPVTMKSITQAVAKRHGLSLEQLRGPQRSHGFAHPRQEAMWIMVKIGRWSLPQIGRFLNRDHTTVLHGYRAHAARLAEAEATKS